MYRGARFLREPLLKVFFSVCNSCLKWSITSVSRRRDTITSPWYYVSHRRDLSLTVLVLNGEVEEDPRPNLEELKDIVQEYLNSLEHGEVIKTCIPRAKACAKNKGEDKLKKSKRENEEQS